MPEGSGIYKKTKQNNTVVDSIFKMAFVVNQINWGLLTIDETFYSLTVIYHFALNIHVFKTFYNGVNFSLFSGSHHVLP